MNDEVQALLSIFRNPDEDHLYEITWPQRPPHYLPVPTTLHPALQAMLVRLYPSGLYAHQTQAIDKVATGDNLCISTATASGKSLIFMAAAANTVLRHPNRTTIILYPLKALLYDQLDKWSTFLRPLNLSVGRIDGGVKDREARLSTLATSNIILATPDILHAWFMRQLAHPLVSSFFSRLQLVVLDEAHTYDGIFGTNCAYLLRRAAAVCYQHQLLLATATIADAAAFVLQLTGRTCTVISDSDNHSAQPAKTLIFLGKNSPACTSPEAVMTSILTNTSSRFLAFSNSRVQTERLVTSLCRWQHGSLDEAMNVSTNWPVLPYRSGYEEIDRLAIQTSLRAGHLRGVVSTSAMEAGLDIGDISLVLMLGLPPSLKSFWQRLGRCGRNSDGLVVVLDLKDQLSGGGQSCEAMLNQPIEPNWLYLQNRYIQFGHAILTVVEMPHHLSNTLLHSPFSGLPDTFSDFVCRLQDAAARFDSDLETIRNRSAACPHLRLSLRSPMQQDFRVLDGKDQRLGTLTLSQVVREAYPGSTYLYIGKPFRVTKIERSKATVRVHRHRYTQTEPNIERRVFADIAMGLLSARSWAVHFLAEAECTVIERVMGFREWVGGEWVERSYDWLSPYSRKPFGWSFRTTGVLIQIEDLESAAGTFILEAFSRLARVHMSDLESAMAFCNSTPTGGPCRLPVLCIFDANPGSLRLTQRLYESFDSVLLTARNIAFEKGKTPLASALSRALVLLSRSTPVTLTGPRLTANDRGWRRVVDIGEIVDYVAGDDVEEILVTGIRLEGGGVFYEVATPHPDQLRLVPEECVKPAFGVTKMVEINMDTGEIRRSIQWE